MSTFHAQAWPLLCSVCGGHAHVTIAIVKMVRFDEIRNILVDAGFDDASVLLAFAISIELVGGVMLGLGYQVRIAAAGLLAYLAALTVLIHADVALSQNVANLASTAGLLMVIAQGSGPFSVEGLVERRRATG